MQGTKGSGQYWNNKRSISC